MTDQSDRPLSIIIAVHHFPPHYNGGAEWRAYRTATALQERGHKIRVVCVERIDTGPYAGANWDDDLFNQIQVRRLSFDLSAAPNPFRWEYDNLWIGDHLADLLQQERPDIFHLISGYLMTGRALRVARQLNIPAVVTLTDFWFLCRRISMLRSNNQICQLPLSPVNCARCFGEEKRRYRLPGQVAPALMQTYWRWRSGSISKFKERAAFLHETLKQTQAIITPSHYLRTVYVNAGIPAEQIIFSRQGHDFAYLTPELLEKVPASNLRIGYLGQIAWHKGVHVLFRAAEQLPHLPLVVKAYGNISQFPHYVTQLERLAANDKRLVLAGTYPRDQISQVFQELDVIIVPSLWSENSPNTILEAFAHQTPVIASNHGGTAELVKHEKNGLLFEPGNVASLAQQLKRLVDEPDLLPRLRAGIEPVKTTSQEMDELEAIYRGIIPDPVRS